MKLNEVVDGLILELEKDNQHTYREEIQRQTANIGYRYDHLLPTFLDDFKEARTQRFNKIVDEYFLQLPKGTIDGISVSNEELRSEIKERLISQCQDLIVERDRLAQIGRTSVLGHTLGRIGNAVCYGFLPAMLAGIVCAGPPGYHQMSLTRELVCFSATYLMGVSIAAGLFHPELKKIRFSYPAEKKYEFGITSVKNDFMQTLRRDGVITETIEYESPKRRGWLRRNALKAILIGALSLYALGGSIVVIEHYRSKHPNSYHKVDDGDNQNGNLQFYKKDLREIIK